MQWSAKFVTFALKLPAIMLHNSPIASRAVEGFDAASPPSINDANLVAVAREQRKVVIPQSAPAMPTMAVCSPCGSSVQAVSISSRTPAIISKTSSAAHSMMGLQLESNGTAVCDPWLAIVFIGLLLAAAQLV